MISNSMRHHYLVKGGAAGVLPAFIPVMNRLWTTLCRKNYTSADTADIEDDSHLQSRSKPNGL